MDSEKWLRRPRQLFFFLIARLGKLWSQIACPNLPGKKRSNWDIEEYISANKVSTLPNLDLCIFIQRTCLHFGVDRSHPIFRLKAGLWSLDWKIKFIHYSKKLKEHFDIMIFIERYPLKRCQGCVKLIASKVNCFLNINDLSEVQLCMSSNSWTWECPHTKDGADHVPLIFLSSVDASAITINCAERQVFSCAR